MSTDNLWGDLNDFGELRSPKQMLEEQAALLETATKGILTGEVKVSTILADFEITFSIVAPHVNNYRYKVLTVRHTLEFFPARVTYMENRHWKTREVQNESELKEAMRQIFQADNTRRVINSLRAQSV